MTLRGCGLVAPGRTEDGYVGELDTAVTTSRRWHLAYVCLGACLGCQP
jgi:hypothetical protein